MEPLARGGRSGLFSASALRLVAAGLVLLVGTGCTTTYRQGHDTMEIRGVDRTPDRRVGAPSRIGFRLLGKDQFGRADADESRAIAVPSKSTGRNDEQAGSSPLVMGAILGAILGARAGIADSGGHRSSEGLAGSVAGVIAGTTEGAQGVRAGEYMAPQKGAESRVTDFVTLATAYNLASAERVRWFQIEADKTVFAKSVGAAKQLLVEIEAFQLALKKRLSERERVARRLSQADELQYRRTISELNRVVCSLDKLTFPLVGLARAPEGTVAQTSVPAMGD